MPEITLPDGSQRQFDHPVTIAQITANLGTKLAKVALAGEVDGKLVDMTYKVTNNAEVTIITDKDAAGLTIIRHSTAHLLAQAVKQLFPQAQVTIGPVIEDGFYYDFAIEHAFTPEDLHQIEAKMKELAKQAQPITRLVMSRDEAIKFFRDLGEEYKAKIITDIPADEPLSLYQQGDFVDLCRGPHVPNTNKLKAFKLTKLAGAYWRGDTNNQMLQRIYGTAWANKKDLAAYLQRIEEAQRRDHRKLAKKMDLFHLQAEAPGKVFWHPNGWIIFQTITQYIREKQKEYGYQEINTPMMADFSLWQASGHADKFHDEMFVTEAENHRFAIKPMNCPLHVQVFNQGLKSYRDLPLRLAEFGCCHRNEPSGTLHGLMRVRALTQDDAHIFCREDQVHAESVHFIKMLYEVYRDFGFNDIIVNLSTRPKKRLGTDKQWDRSEQALAEALNTQEIAWQENPGEGAFYGPKLEFSMRDCLGRLWQLGTLQFDSCLPTRLGAVYIAENGEKMYPVMLHRAIFGSFERFIGILLEHYADGLPLWLAPIQAVVMNITDQQADYAAEIVKNLQKDGLKVKLDLRNEKIGFKIRQHSIARVPYLLLVGAREIEQHTIAVRIHSGENLGSMSLKALQQRLITEVSTCGKLRKEDH